MVDVCHIHTHAISLVIQTDGYCVFGKGAVSIVFKKFIDLIAVMSDVEVLITIVVGIKKDAAHSNACIHRPGWKRYILEPLTTQVAVHGIVAVHVHHIDI